MIGALGARALSDAGPKALAAEWGGAGLVVPGARVVRPVGLATLRPVRARTSL